MRNIFIWANMSEWRESMLEWRENMIKWIDRMKGEYERMTCDCEWWDMIFHCCFASYQNVGLDTKRRFFVNKFYAGCCSISWRIFSSFLSSSCCCEQTWKRCRVYSRCILPIVIVYFEVFPCFIVLYSYGSSTHKNYNMGL